MSFEEFHFVYTKGTKKTSLEISLSSNDVFKKKNQKKTPVNMISVIDLKTKFLMPKICHIFLYN